MKETINSRCWNINSQLNISKKYLKPREYLSSEISKSRRHSVNTWFLYRSDMKKLNVMNDVDILESFKEIHLELGGLDEMG